MEFAAPRPQVFEAPLLQGSLTKSPGVFLGIVIVSVGIVIAISFLSQRLPVRIFGARR
jgi:hypothetical protein